MALKIKKQKEIDKSFANKRYDKAIELLVAAQKEYPSDASIRLRLADAYYLSGRSDMAVKILTNIAQAFARAGFMTKAMAVSKKIERIDPSTKIDIYQFLEPEQSDLAPQEVPSMPTAEEEPEKVDASFTVLDHLFHGLTKSEYQEVFAELEGSSLKSGEMVFRQGDSDNSSYIIVEGSVEISADTKGKKISLATLKSGDFFGEVAMITGKERTASVKCAEDCEFLIMRRENFLSLSKKYPTLQQNMSKALEERAMSTITRMLEAE